MAKARAITDLSPDQSYAEAAARIVSVRSDELYEHASGVLNVGDIERLHDMRVATRRLRAALEVFEPCFPRKPFRRVLDDVKALADGLGERRDRDVALASLTDFAAEMPTADQPGLESLLYRFRNEQSRANDALIPLVTEEHLQSLRKALDGLVRAPSGPPSAAGDGAGPDR